MHTDFFIANLRKHKDELEELISRLKEKNALDQEDLQMYDVATKQIEKRLRTLRSYIVEEVSKTVAINQNQKGYLG